MFEAMYKSHSLLYAVLSGPKNTKSSGCIYYATCYGAMYVVAGISALSHSADTADSKQDLYGFRDCLTRVE